VDLTLEDDSEDNAKTQEAKAHSKKQNIAKQIKPQKKARQHSPPKNLYNGRLWRQKASTQNIL